jgi:hypothetical protein
LGRKIYIANKNNRIMEKILQIKSIKDTDNDLEYWKSRSAQERIDALEMLRSQYLQLQNNPLLKDVQQRLQRVLRITQQKSN